VTPTAGGVHLEFLFQLSAAFAYPTTTCCRLGLRRTAEDGEKGCEMAAAERPDIIGMSAMT
jgi:hypothetical protein